MRGEATLSLAEVSGEPGSTHPQGQGRDRGRAVQSSAADSRVGSTPSGGSDESQSPLVRGGLCSLSLGSCTPAKLQSKVSPRSGNLSCLPTYYFPNKLIGKCHL